MRMFPALSAAAALVALWTAPAFAGACSQNACARQLNGVVTSGPARGAQPVQNAKVSIYRAERTAPVLLAQTTSNAQGQFSARLPPQAADETRYAVAAKGRIELITVMAPGDRPDVRINEMTTVATAYAMAQFIDAKAISGKALPLKIAASMFRNLAMPDRGEVSQVLRRSPNGDETNARRLMATLSNVLAGCVRNGATGSCAQLFANTGGATTLEAAINIARKPATNVREIFALGNSVQPFQPALSALQGPDAPNELMRLDAFTIAVKVNRTSAQPGQESCPFAGTGNLVFDDRGYAWITNNVVAGTNKSANCFAVLKPDGQPADGKGGTPNSPLSGGGVLGQGYGITRDPSGNIWAGNFGWGGVNPPAGSVSKFSRNGTALSPSSGYVSSLYRVQGMASDQAGNIWMASYGNNRIQVFPGGDQNTAYPYFSDGNEEPFDIVVDDAGAAYVSYKKSSTLSKLTMGVAGLNRVFNVPIGTKSFPKGIALDSKGNVWATAEIGSKIHAYDSTDGTELGSYTGGGILGPWGVAVDSHDTVWVANFGPDKPVQVNIKYRLSQLCGASEEYCPAGMRIGDPITPDTGYTLPSGGAQVRLASGKPLYYPVNQPSYKPMMRSTAARVDMAGNVWVTNNWKPSEINDVLSNPGGDGIVIFVGLAAPVKPGIGVPKAP